ncbi:MAG TPA: dihydroneopterin aldolase [Stellaceae bacterium]|nr:dihydroneopterin aldolase [Stellaceae bacterium]
MNTGEPLSASAGAAPAYTVTVRGLVVFASIGVTKQEHDKRQRVRVSVDLVAAPAAAAAVLPGEDRRRVINYHRVVAAVRQIAGSGHIDLCEGFAERVCAACLADPRVARVRVWVEKLDIYPDAEGVGAVIERSRPR